MTIKMTAHLCGAWDDGKLYQGHDYTVSFTTEEQAVTYVSGKRSTTNFYELDDCPLDGYETLLGILHPACEHGLSLQSCYGPNHYPSDDVVNSWYV